MKSCQAQEWIAPSESQVDVTPIVALSQWEHAVQVSLRELDPSAIYTSIGEGGTVSIFLVVERSSDSLYKSALEIENKLANLIPKCIVEIRIRECHGRHPGHAVPTWTSPIYIK